MGSESGTSPSPATFGEEPRRRVRRPAHGRGHDQAQVLEAGTAPHRRGMAPSPRLQRRHARQGRDRHLRPGLPDPESRRERTRCSRRCSTRVRRQACRAPHRGHRPDEGRLGAQGPSSSSSRRRDTAPVRRRHRLGAPTGPSTAPRQAVDPPADAPTVVETGQGRSPVSGPPRREGAQRRCKCSRSSRGDGPDRGRSMVTFDYFGPCRARQDLRRVLQQRARPVRRRACRASSRLGRGPPRREARQPRAGHRPAGVRLRRPAAARPTSRHGRPSPSCRRPQGG